MDDFISLHDRYVGYPLTLDEARRRYVKERYSASAWALLSKEERDADERGSHPLLWMKIISSELHTFVQSPLTQNWHRIPPGYWIDHTLELNEILQSALDRKLSAIVERRTYMVVPGQFVGQPITVWRDDIDALVAKAPAEAEVGVLVLNTVLAKVGKSAVHASTTPAPSSPSAAREAECRRVAAELDRRGVTVRSVKAHMIEDLWDNRVGKRPNVGAITGLMAGGGEGGRPPKIHKNRQFT